MILVLIYFTLSKINTERLLAIIIVSFIFVYVTNIVNEQNKKLESSKIQSKMNLKNDVKDMKEINTSNFYVKEISQSLKYLLKNNAFISLIHNISFVKKFDKTRYIKIIANMDKLMKVYIYILVDRYDLNTYLPIFMDLRTDILEIFYSFIFVIPEKFKHIYGFDPYEQIHKSRDEFSKITNNMLFVLQNYGKIEKQQVYINFEKYKPYEKNKESYLP
jgi:hypothetical protein